MSDTAKAALKPAMRPDIATSIELLKPITWFPPMWAFMCGVVSAGAAFADSWALIIAGAVLAGPLVCGTSQAVNDWFDRHVDAINEPGRPVPSGRMPGKSALYLAIAWTVLSLIVAAALGTWVLAAAAIGLVLAWMYSAPPFRLKQNGWWGNAAVGLCYEGLPWLTGAAVMLGGFPSWQIVAVAIIYSVGAHGIMTLNDFKSIEGDLRSGVRSLPAQLGAGLAAWVSCGVMALAQVAVVILLVAFDRPWHAAAVAGLLSVQLVLMRKLLAAPKDRAPWYNATGVTLYVIGMLVSAFALAAHG